MATKKKEAVRQVVKKQAIKRKLAKRKEAPKRKEGSGTKKFERVKNEKHEKYKGVRKTELKRREAAKGSHLGAGVGSRAQQVAILMAMKEGKIDAARDVKSNQRMDKASKNPGKYKKFKRKGK